MPDIPLSSQIFDIAFHPTRPILLAALLTGEVKAFGFDEGFRSSDGDGEREELEERELVEVGTSMGGKAKGKSDESKRKATNTITTTKPSLSGSSSPSPSSSFAHPLFTLRPSKRSCRGLATSTDGTKVYAVGKGKGMFTIDVENAKIVDSRLGAHQAAINRVERLMANLLVTGDDDGVVKLWDPRKRDELRSYDHHFDFISDFMWMEEKKQVVVTSGDGTLSVIDTRSSKPTPFAQSEDQEDELLSVVSLRGGAKTVVGTQMGILSVFNKSSGWGDCVDRIPGHPHSIDALCNLPSSYPSSHSTILTGSSDGLLRAVQLFPTKLIGVIADHGEFPIERVKVDREGEGMWVGSVGHDEVVRMTCLREMFEDEGKGGSGSEDESESESGEENGDGKSGVDLGVKGGDGDSDDSDSDDSEDEASPSRPIKPKSKVQSKAMAESQADSESESESEDESRHASDSGASSGEEEEEDLPKEKKRKLKIKDPLDVGRKSKKGRKNEFAVDKSFFSGL